MTADARSRKELPAKVPVLLMLGAEGIAVGMSTTILPHNFLELLEAQIAILREKSSPCTPTSSRAASWISASTPTGSGR